MSSAPNDAGPASISGTLAEAGQGAGTRPAVDNTAARAQRQREMMCGTSGCVVGLAVALGLCCAGDPVGGGVAVAGALLATTVIGDPPDRPERPRVVRLSEAGVSGPHVFRSAAPVVEPVVEEDHVSYVPL